MLQFSLMYSLYLSNWTSVSSGLCNITLFYILAKTEISLAQYRAKMRTELNNDSNSIQKKDRFFLSFVVLCYSVDRETKYKKIFTDCHCKNVGVGGFFQ